jgi:hypothetical protein
MRVYVLPGDKPAADAIKKLVDSINQAGWPIAIEAKGNLLTVTGTEGDLAKIEPLIAAIGKGKLVEARTGPGEPRVEADSETPHATVVRAIEWLRAHQAAGEPPAAAAPNVPAQIAKRQRDRERKILQLDLQAAELELQAAQQELHYAERLSAQKAISETELSSKRFAVERARIQVAKLKVMLEDDEPPAAPPPANVPPNPVQH